MDGVRDRQVPKKRAQKFLNSVAACWNYIHLLVNVEYGQN